MSSLLAPLFFAPALKERVWGGQQLGGSAQAPVGEAWAVHEELVPQGDEWAGRTLADLAREFPAELVGEGWSGERFPLLIKLLDCQDWLSVQVHPNDAQAQEMVGPGELGKTEAWHVLHAEPGAKLISGTRPDVNAEILERGIRTGQVSELTQEQAVSAGDTLLVPAGTLHALGPGLLIYEVQQTSDTTYRVYDWDRPASAGRELHLEQSAAVTRPAQAHHVPAASVSDAATESKLTHCEYFVLEELRSGPGRRVEGQTASRSFHALTLKSGEAVLRVGSRTFPLSALQTVLLPAALGAYSLEGDFHALRASLPE